jgi:hypothetical protein
VEQGSKLNISQVQPPHIEPQDANWLRMDPYLTRAVLAKTEEELLGSLAALMRNKVEHEQASRRFAHIQIDTEQAKLELETIKQQIRHAEEEVATRLNEQSRINEEIVRVRQELEILRERHRHNSEMDFSRENEGAHTQRSAAEGHRNLSSLLDATEPQSAAHRDAIGSLVHIKKAKAALEESLTQLRMEIDERIKARETLITEVLTIRQHVSDLAASKEQQTAEVSALGNSRAELRNKLEVLRAEQESLVSEVENLRQSVARHTADKERLAAVLTDLHNEIAVTAEERRRQQELMAEQQARVSDLSVRKENLEQVVAMATDKHRELQANVAALDSRLQELSEAAEKAEQARIAEGLPLLFGTESHRISPEWDSYPLESEFHTDEELDAKKVAELVSVLPGLEGCLIVRNHGSVLASKLPERIHAQLKVPNRNYHLLFDRLEKKVEEYSLQNARLATFDLGEEALTVAQSNHAFVFVNHRQTKLRPGMPGKLASIVSEIAKMYP